MGIAKKISDRLKECDRIQGENLRLVRGLASEAERKADYLSEQIIKTEKKLKNAPDNKSLQKEYAGQIMARRMFIAAKNLNESILESDAID